MFPSSMKLVPAPRRPTPIAIVALAVAAALGPGPTTASTPPTAAKAAEPAAKVTYVANEGFLLEIDGKKILVDALFHGDDIDWCHAPAPDTVRRMEKAEAPFDGVDLILITHRHVDHFTPELVLAHLASHPGAVVVAPPQATAELRALPAWTAAYESRVKTPDLDLFESFEVTHHGIRAEAFLWRHSTYMLSDEKTGESYNKHEDIENLVFLVEVGDLRLMHLGDAFFWENLEFLDERYLPRQKVHLLFLEGWSEEYQEKLLHWLTPGHLVFMHLPAEPEQAENLSRWVTERVPGALVFTEPMTTRCFHRSPGAGAAGGLSDVPCAPP